MLERLPMHFDIFPSIAQLEQFQEQFIPKPAPVTQADRPFWVSARAPGTPASVEALFAMIEGNMTNSGAFAAGLNYCRITEDRLWLYYEAWTRGEVHPDLRRQNAGSEKDE